MILNFTISSQRAKKFFEYIGLTLWLFIIFIKLNRYFKLGILEALSDNLPSFLGSAGLFLILLSNKGKLSKLTVVQSVFIAIAISVIIELIQLLPRPGIFSYINYSFDYIDLLFSIIGVLISYLVILLLHSKKNLEL